MKKDLQYKKFCSYGFLKNLRFFDAFLLLYFIEIGMDFTQVGILYAARELVINLAEIPSGVVADSFGRRRSLLLAFGLYVISFVLFYYSTNFHLLLAAMIMMGMGDAFRSGTHKGMIMDYLKIHDMEDYKVQYYGATRSWSQRGSALSALVAGIIVFFSSDYRTIYLVAIVPYILNFVNILTYPSSLDVALKKKNKSMAGWRQLLSAIIRSVRQKEVVQVINSAALHSAYLKSIKDYIQPLIVHLSLLIPLGLAIDSKSKSGIVVGLVYFVIYLLTSIASKKAYKVLEYRIPRLPTRSLLLGFVIGLLSGVFYYCELWIVSIILFVSVFLIENIRKPIMTGLLVDQVPNEILTSVLSSQSFYATLATSLISVGIGVLADSLGVGLALAIVSFILMAMTLLINLAWHDVESGKRSST